MTTSSDSETDENVWFRIDPDDPEEADLGDPDDPDDPFPDPRMDPVPRAFVRRLRDLTPMWREFGLTRWGTGGLYSNGRVWVLASVSDREADLSVGKVRVDLTSSEWIGSWVQGGNPTDAVLEDAEPMGEPVRDPFTDPEAGIERAVQWMIAQFQRPLIRRVWRQGDRTVAESWTFDDTGKVVIVSGDQQHWSRPETADEAVRVSG